MPSAPSPVGQRLGAAWLCIWGILQGILPVVHHRGFGPRIVVFAGWIGDHFGVYKPQENAWALLAAGATFAVAAAQIGGAASWKDEDWVAHLLLFAACCATCTAALSIRLALGYPTSRLWLKDVSGFAIVFLILSLASTSSSFSSGGHRFVTSSRRRRSTQQNQDLEAGINESSPVMD
ncbi:uncharacterized protein PG986_015073 [Apiospora aurea]|uniref:Uncharacterized protein n=1 Tax=Apiospora aurea TaxID=335848 RepID=A0ABR1PRI9_9PEZI